MQKKYKEFKNNKSVKYIFLGQIIFVILHLNHFKNNIITGKSYYEDLVEMIGLAYAYCQIIYDDEKNPVDFKLLQFNELFQLTYLSGDKYSEYFTFKRDFENWEDNQDIIPIIEELLLEPKSEFLYYYETNKRIHKLKITSKNKYTFYLVELPDLENGDPSTISERDKYNQTIKNERFLRELSFKIAELEPTDNPFPILLKGIKQFTGASLAAFSFYDDAKKALIVQAFEADNFIIKSIIGVAGEKIATTESPLSNEMYNKILQQRIGIGYSFTEVTFGAIPENVDMVIRKLTGIAKFYGIAHIVQNELYGTTMIAFKKNVPEPSLDLLQAYSNLSAITLKKKRAEKQYAELESKVSQLLELAPDAFLQGDEKGNFIYVNEKATVLTGYSKEELLQMNMRDLFTDNELNKKPLRYDLLDKGETVLIARQIRRKDGTEVYVEMNSQKNPDNTYQSFIRDITERKEFEKQILIAKEKAEESDKLKSAFLANMSHEIRTPMNGILGFTELLKEPDLSEEDKAEFIDIIQKSGNRMLSLINDLIDISKIESGMMQVSLDYVNLSELIEYIFSFFRPEIEAKGMNLVIENSVQNKNAIIKTDQEKLYAIMINLVKNAIKYTEKGEIRIGCEIEGNNYKFWVKDTGIGIAKDRQEAIFERFVQADITNPMAKQGTGLGLAITKAYVEMLGGKIWLESDLGVGSTFYFTLPIGFGADIEEINENEKISGEHMDNLEQIIPKIKVLIVEDDETSLKLLVANLNKYVGKILEATSGKEAIEIYKNNPDTDLILMDIQLPDLNGYEVTKEIRKINEEVIIFAQSAYTQPENKVKAFEAGCDEYIAKPIDRNDLKLLISKYFRK